MFDDPRTPLAGVRRHDLPRSADTLPSLPPGAAPAATLLATIDRHLALARRAGQHLALLAVTLDPPAPDAAAPPPALVEALAVEFGNRLRARVRASDTVLWQGGCNHLVLLQPCRHAGAMAARLRLEKALGGIYRLGQTRLAASASIGCASYPAAGDTATQLLAAALAAARGDTSR